jgi:hypothetical protein
MGAQPYWYFTKYQPDIDDALQTLRRREFEAGRYNPVIPFLEFPIDPSKPSPGAQHTSIEEAQEAADADGTRSILDIERVGQESDFGVAAALDHATLDYLYDTTEPTHEMVESNMGFFGRLERGHGVYLIVFRNGQPDELFFAGYSYD